MKSVKIMYHKKIGYEYFGIIIDADSEHHAKLMLIKNLQLGISDFNELYEIDSIESKDMIEGT